METHPRAQPMTATAQTFQRVTVMLTDAEIEHACLVGCKREVHGRRTSGRWGCPSRGLSWDYHITGALGEKGGAKHLQIPWDGRFLQFDAADVGLYQVRATEYLNGRLILHKPEGHRPDKPGDIFILAIVELPAVILAGWIYGADGQQQQWWDDTQREPAYFVPQKHLNPMSTIPRDEQPWE